MVGRYPIAHKAMRRRQAFEQVYRYLELTLCKERGGGIETGRACTYNSDS
jgi:hypothetical protein